MMKALLEKFTTGYTTTLFAFVLALTPLIAISVNGYGQRKPRRPQLPNPDLFVGSQAPFRLVGSSAAPLCVGRQDIAVRIENALGHAGTSQLFTVRLNLHQQPAQFDQTVNGIGAALGPTSGSKLVIFRDVNITGPGALSMIVTVDMGDRVDETNEDNNRTSFTLNVAGNCPPYSSQ
jgi:hypothetical protein